MQYEYAVVLLLGIKSIEFFIQSGLDTSLVAYGILAGGLLEY